MYQGPAPVVGTGDIVTNKVVMVPVGSEGRRPRLNNSLLRSHLITGIIMFNGEGESATLLQLPSQEFCKVGRM